MKTLVSILKNIFVPMSSLLFLFIGIIASICSAVIEYLVLAELLAVKDIALPSHSIALLIVSILEGAKYTLYFYSESLKKESLKDTVKEFSVVKMRRFTEVLKIMLVIFSIACSMIFMVNVFYADSGESAEALLQENQENCDSILSNEKERLLAEKEQAIESEIALYDNENRAIENLNAELSTLNESIQNEAYMQKRQDLIGQAVALGDKISESTEAYSNRIESIHLSAEESYREELLALEAIYGAEGSARLTITDEMVAMAGDNQYLKTFLLAITTTFFQKSYYSRMIYLLMTMFISLTITIALESCILLSQKLLSIPIHTFMLIVGELPTIDKYINTVKIGIWLLFSTMCSMAVYLLVSIPFRIELNSEMIVLALLTYWALYLMENLILAI